MIVSDEVPIPRTADLRRREFLEAGAVGAVGLLGASVSTADDTEPRVRRYKTLGRTGMEISDISFGSSRMRDPKAVRHAYERGVNYFDSAEGYKGGDSESAIGEAPPSTSSRSSPASPRCSSARTLKVSGSSR